MDCKGKKKIAESEKTGTPSPPEENVENSAAEDQEVRGYYYDDAHGYRKYEPTKDDSEMEES